MADILSLKNNLDSKNMYAMIAAMPDHIEEGINIGQDVVLKHLELETFGNIIVAGMGGSAIAGDLLKSYLLDVLELPLFVCRHYKLPGFVNKRTLVICSSYSGDTEETLSAYDDALRQGARVIAITTGGKLADKALQDDVPVARLKKGLPPRAALGYSFGALLTILGRLGMCDPSGGDLSNAEIALKGWLPRYEPENKDNPAIKLAEQISGRIPVIYSGCERMDAVALRFKCQIGENAKSLAFTNIFPELCHNELVGWQELYGLDSRFVAVILRDREDHKRIQSRMEIVADYLEQRKIKVLTLESEKGSRLTRMFYFIQYLDFTSYYLALLNGVDPYPIKAIDYLKERLLAID